MFGGSLGSLCSMWNGEMMMVKMVIFHGSERMRSYFGVFYV